MSAPSGCYGFGPFTLDTAERLLTREGRVVPLTPKAFDLLTVLVHDPGRLLTKEELISQVWPDAFVEESNLSYNIFAIRKALGSSDDDYIETVPKRGYRFVATVRRTPAPASAGALTPAASNVPQTEVVAGVGHRGRPWPWSRTAIAATLAGLAALVALAALTRRTPKPPPLVRFQVSVPLRLLDPEIFSVSPDGRHFVFNAAGSDGVVRLWIRGFDVLDARPIPGTELTERGAPPPIWSPDNRFVAFDAGGHLEKVDLEGGSPQKVCDLPGLGVGGTWNEEGVILVGNSNGSLIRCPASGGPAVPATALDPSRQEDIHLFPSFLPDGRHFLYLRISRRAPENSGLYVGELDVPASAQSEKRLLLTGFGATYVPAADGGPGHILLVRDHALMAQRFDPRRLQLSGEPLRVAGPVGSFLDYAFFSASANGLLMFRSPAQGYQLKWFDRAGNVLSRVSEPGPYLDLALAPDGTRAVAVKHISQTTVNQDLWLFDFSRDSARRLTFGPFVASAPMWSADSSRIIFSSGLGGDLYEKPVTDDGAPRLVLKSGEGKFATSMSPDSRFLLYTAWSLGPTKLDVWVLPVDGGRSATTVPLIRREADQSQAQFSPDGRWVAYVSDESGPDQVSVTAFSVDSTGTPRSAESYPIGEGTAPRWCRDGKELDYLGKGEAVMAVDVDTAHGFRTGAPRVLFRAVGALPRWGVTADGNRLLLAVPAEGSAPPPFDVMLNWQAALGQ